MRDPFDFPLPLRHERFITEYLIDQNAGTAARRAGYAMKSRARQGSRQRAANNKCVSLRPKCPAKKCKNMDIYGHPVR